MKNFKKIISLIMLVTILSMSLIGCSGENAEPQGEGTDIADLPEVEWKMSNSQAPDHFYNIALENMSEYVSEQTDGKFKIEVYHSGTLGTEQEIIEGMQLGQIGGTLAAASLFANFVPSYELFSLPALFKDSEQLKAVMNDEEITSKFKEEAEASDIYEYGFYQSYFRQHYTKDPVTDLESMQGQKIRVMGSDIIVQTFQALGANPTTTAWGELYTALQLGVAEGMDHVASSVRANAFYEHMNYVSEPNLFVTPMFVIISKPMYDELPQQYKDILDDAIENVLLVELREKADNANKEDLEYLKTEGGLEFIEVDIEEIHEAAAPVRDRYIDELDDWVQDIAKEILAQ